MSLDIISHHFVYLHTQNTVRIYWALILAFNSLHLSSAFITAYTMDSHWITQERRLRKRLKVVRVRIRWPYSPEHRYSAWSVQTWHGKPDSLGARPSSQRSESHMKTIIILRSYVIMTQYDVCRQQTSDRGGGRGVACSTILLNPYESCSFYQESLLTHRLVHVILWPQDHLWFVKGSYLTCACASCLELKKWYSDMASTHNDCLCFSASMLVLPHNATVMCLNPLHEHINLNY